MKSPADNNQSVEPRPDGPIAPSGASQTSLACPATYAPSMVLFQQFIYGQLDMLGRRVHDLEKHLDRLAPIVEQQYRRCDDYLAILAACQRDTSNALNHELERRAIHPAIEAVVALAEELARARDCVRDCAGGVDNESPGAAGIGGGAGSGMDLVRPVLDISCGIAQEKLANLNVEMIAPAKGDALDAMQHTVCGCVDTPDESLCQKISSLVTAGFAYGGKVLRPARVIVFRMKAS